MQDDGVSLWELTSRECDFSTGVGYRILYVALVTCGVDAEARELIL